jgi:hypothetical protein
MKAFLSRLYVKVWWAVATRWWRLTGKPPIVYLDQDGCGWRELPDYADAHQPDWGQHETWKREMRVWLYRVLHDHVSLSLNMKLVGLGSRTESVPVLLPMGLQLADACRRLGYRQLAEAAVPDLGTWVSDPEEALLRAFTQNARAVEEEADRREAMNARTRASWKPEHHGGAEFNPDSRETTVALLSVGEFDPASGAVLIPIQSATIDGRPPEILPTPASYILPKARRA